MPRLPSPSNARRAALKHLQATQARRASRGAGQQQRGDMPSKQRCDVPEQRLPRYVLAAASVVRRAEA
jgi:hypothetical protein